MNASWHNLPNASHIERVINSFKTNLINWDQAHELDWDLDWRQSWRQSWRQAQYQVWLQSRMGEWNHTQSEGWLQVGRAWDKVSGALLALVAYDYSSQFLSMTYDSVKMWTLLSYDPAVVLLIPAVKVLNGETHDH